MIVDCHVDIWNDEHAKPLFYEQLGRVRPGGVKLKADAETVVSVLTSVDRSIIFSLRYHDSLGIDGDDEVTAAAVHKYPDRFVGFAEAVENIGYDAGIELRSDVQRSRRHPISFSSAKSM